MSSSSLASSSAVETDEDVHGSGQKLNIKRKPSQTYREACHSKYPRRQLATRSKSNSSTKGSRHVSTPELSKTSDSSKSPSELESDDEPKHEYTKPRSKQTARKGCHSSGPRRGRAMKANRGLAPFPKDLSSGGCRRVSIRQYQKTMMLDKWANDDDCDLYKPTEPELQEVEVYHPCLVTANSDLIITCYENEEKLKTGEQPIGIIPCESKIMARRFKYFEAMMREGSNWRESQCSTSSARNQMNKITIKSKNSSGISQISTQIIQLKKVTSLFNPEKLCEFIESVINRKIKLTPDNCLSYLKMTVFYQDHNSELEKVIIDYIKTEMTSELALAVWQVQEAAELRDDSILFFKNNPKELKYDCLSTVPVENLMVLLCELGEKKDRSEIVDYHEFDSLVEFCMNDQTKKVPGLNELFSVYEKRQAEKIEEASKISTTVYSTDTSSSG